MTDTPDNIFDKPYKYLDEIRSATFFSDEQIRDTAEAFSGKSIMCAWLTKKCPLNCKFCFFKSNSDCEGLLPREHSLTDDGVNALIKFVEDSNNGYLMLSGGGDPFVMFDAICKIIREARTDRIVLVTSGFWAVTVRSAEETIKKLSEAIKARDVKKDGRTEVVLRLSIDQDHMHALGDTITPYINIIRVFDDSRLVDKALSLSIHTMRDDDTIDKVVNAFGACYEKEEKGVSDNPYVIKIVPERARLTLCDGYSIDVSIAKVFLSNLMVNLNDDSEEINEAIRVFNEDMEKSEQDNPSYVQNTSGKKGFDFWVDYNGNVTTWFNQDKGELFNLYTDSYDDVVRKTLSNPITVSFLRKGYLYRNHIVGEVNEKAVRRSMAINLRDYAAAILLEEDRTKLYYAIRVIRDMVDDCSIDIENIRSNEGLSPEIKEVILQSTTKELADMHAASRYDILKQEMEQRDFDEVIWSDLFSLVALGHYSFDRDNLESQLNRYKEGTDWSFDSSSLDEFLSVHAEERYGRLHMRLSEIKEEALACV